MSWKDRIRQTKEKSWKDRIRQTKEKPDLNAPSQVEAAARGFGQDLTLGFGDEIAGAGAGAIEAIKGGNWESIVKAYEGFRDSERRANEKSEKNHPWTYNVAGIVAPLGPLGLVAKAGKGAYKAVKAADKVDGLIKATAKGAGKGAAIGATAGVGYGKGDVKDHIESGAIGATLGAVLGGGVSVAGKAVKGSLGSRVSSMIERRAKEGKSLTPDLGKSGDGIKKLFESLKKTDEVKELAKYIGMKFDANGKVTTFDYSTAPGKLAKLGTGKHPQLDRALAKVKLQASEDIRYTISKDILRKARASAASPVKTPVKELATTTDQKIKEFTNQIQEMVDANDPKIPGTLKKFAATHGIEKLNKIIKEKTNKKILEKTNQKIKEFTNQVQEMVDVPILDELAAKRELKGFLDSGTWVIRNISAEGLEKYGGLNKWASELYDAKIPDSVKKFIPKTNLIKMITARLARGMAEGTAYNPTEEQLTALRNKFKGDK